VTFTSSKVGDAVRIRGFLRRAQQTEYLMGIGSLWVVTEGMREQTYRLAAQGKPYPDPEIAHIMYEVAAAVLDRYVWQILAYAGAGLLLLAAATAAAATGSGLLAGGLAVLALAAAAMARHTAKTVRIWGLVHRANSSAQ
jgi:hypothetical protein